MRWARWAFLGLSALITLVLFWYWPLLWIVSLMTGAGLFLTFYLIGKFVHD